MKMVHIYNIYNFVLKNRVKIVQKFKNTQNMKLQFFCTLFKVHIQETSL